MFGLFKKTGFDAEMGELEVEAKKLWSRQIIAMQSMDIRSNILITTEIVGNYNKKIDCCNKYSRGELANKFKVEKEKLLSLLG